MFESVLWFSPVIDLPFVLEVSRAQNVQHPETREEWTLLVCSLNAQLFKTVYNIGH